MKTCNPTSTPMEPGSKLSKIDCPQTNDELIDMQNVPYKPLVGFLMHVSVSTRPNISYSTNTIAQFLSNLSRKHWSFAKRILRYLKGTQFIGLLYKGSNKHFILKGYIDADWAGNMDTRRSTTSYCFILGNCVVSWASHKQRSVALSSTESEYMALSNASTNSVRNFVDS